MISESTFCSKVFNREIFFYENISSYKSIPTKFNIIFKQTKSTSLLLIVSRSYNNPQAIKLNIIYILYNIYVI